MHRTVSKNLCIALSVTALSTTIIAQDVVVPLWSDGAPNETETVEPEVFLPRRAEDSETVPRLTNVSEPRIEVFYAPADRATGTAVLVAPGGGYDYLAAGHEGEMVIEWLNRIGVTGVLLKYRVPRRVGRPKHAAPLEDAQRAMSLIRAHASEWGIDPNRVGMLGFSAGGHLTLATGTNAERRSYPMDPEVDSFSARPSFLIPVYPAYLLQGDDAATLTPEIQIDETTPPTLLIHAHNDSYSAVGSALVYMALHRADVAAEIHVYTRGGHGFGMRRTEHPVSSWPDRAEQWMRSMHWID